MRFVQLLRDVQNAVGISETRFSKEAREIRCVGSLSSQKPMTLQSCTEQEKEPFSCNDFVIPNIAK
jgi:hypothetical protein